MRPANKDALPRGVSICVKRGVARLRVMIEAGGVRRTKWYPDADARWVPEAVQWREAARMEIEAGARPRPEQEPSATRATTSSGSVRLLDTANGMLRHDRVHSKGATLEERRRWLHRFVWHFEPDAVDPARHVPGATWEDVLLDAEGEYTPERIEEFFDQVAEEISGCAANKAKKNLSRMWKVMRKKVKELRRFPNPFVEIESYPEERQPLYVPPAEDVWKVYDLASGAEPEAVQDRAIQMMFLHTAARPGEVFYPNPEKPPLGVKDLYLDEMLVGLWTMKTGGKGWRYDRIPMTQQLRAALEEWLDVRPIRNDEHLFYCCTKASGFGAASWGQPFFKRQHFLARNCARAGVRRWTWRAYRPFVARSLYVQGHPISHVQTLLRHESEATTKLYLTSLGAEHIRPMMDRHAPRRGNVVEIGRFRAERGGDEAQTKPAPGACAREG